MLLKSKDKDSIPDISVVSSGEAVEESGQRADGNSWFTPKTIRRNMIFCVMLDAIFYMGYTDMNLALQPLLVYLHASNFMIGVVTSLPFMGLVGAFFSPYITRRFARKKLYLMVVNVPFLAAIGFLGLGTVYSKQLGISDPSLFKFVFICLVCHWFFQGFTALPHQEYIAACIPSSHRGRFTGFSFSISGMASILSASIGGLILLKMSKPMAFGYLFIMTWAICQGGYVSALFAREKPTPVEQSPKPWSKQMLKAVWDDKPFVNFLSLSCLISILVYPIFGFINIYGFKELHMNLATSAIIQIITQVTRIGVCAFAGVLTDKYGPKKVYPYTAIFAFLSLVPVIFIHNQYGVYISVVMSTIYTALMTAAFYTLMFGLPSPENRAGHYTIQIVSSYVVQVIGPIIIGGACDLIPFRTVFIIVAIIALAFYPLSKYMLSCVKDKLPEYN